VGNFKTWDVIIIGGGLAGLSCALHLSQNNINVILIEKNKYPNHKVCGEYVSNEVLPYFQKLGIDPCSKGAKKINKFEISNKKGNLIKAKLPLGGFGISRFTFDNLLFEKLKDTAEVEFDTVETIDFSSDVFSVKTLKKKEFKAKYVLGAFGKRSNIDVFMKRNFIQKPSHWLAVKAHYNYDFPEDTVALHNFEGGYCGLSKVENNAVNACYLTTFKSFKKAGNIDALQKNNLSKNPYLKHFFSHSKSIFEKPLTISQVSFQKKEPVEDHVFMLGDSAGLIHPLCGNGMAMAIHSAKIFSELFLKEYITGSIDRNKLEHNYKTLWEETFSNRLKSGRLIQHLLLNPLTTDIGFSVSKIFPSIIPTLIKQTHGSPLI